MKFDVVVGNPPYQQNVTNNRLQPPVYHLYYDLAEKISTQYSLITPARFLFNIGATPKKWNNKMLNDKHLKIVYYNPTASTVFENVLFTGGICIIYRNDTLEFEPIELYIPCESLKNIYLKVQKSNPESLSSIITREGLYRYNDKMHNDNPEVKTILPKTHQYDIASNAFDTLNNIIFFDDITEDGSKYVKIIGRSNAKRVYKYIKKEYLKPIFNFDKYKVIITKVNGKGLFGEVLSKPQILEPNAIFTQTFISIGSFETEIEASNCLKYIKSKFARTMLGVLKVTQDSKQRTWAKVPLQNFTSSSDIDWTQSTPNIDNQLYKKYDLSQAEIVFIEENIKPME